MVFFSGNDVHGSLKALSSTKNVQNVKCGKNTFKTDNYLNLLFVKVGKAGRS